jgi:hypothetical protein
MTAALVGYLVVEIFISCHAGRPRTVGLSTVRGIEHDELAVERLQHDLGAEALDVALVCPLTGFQRAFDVDLATLMKVGLDKIGESFAEDHDAMPFGLFTAFTAVLICPGFRCCDREVHNLPAALQGANVGVTPQVADQLHFVEVSGHCRSPSLLLLEGNRPFAGPRLSGAVC